MRALIPGLVVLAAASCASPRVPVAPPIHPPQILLATLCEGDPAQARWTTSARAPGPDVCYLPWAENPGALAPRSHASGWVDLDLNNLGGECAGTPPSMRERRARVAPAVLYAHIPVEGTATVRARALLGHEADGGFLGTGWAGWRTVPVRPARGQILHIPLNDVIGDAQHWVQVEVNAGGVVRVVDLIWPVSC